MRRLMLIAGLAAGLMAVPAIALGPGETALVTQATSGANVTPAEAYDVSADGRCVVFVSASDPLPGSNGSQQVYLRDTVAKTTTLVSINTTGTQGGNGDSDSPVVTPDCHYVSWDSAAHNLTASPETERLVYRRDLRTGTTILVSRAPDGTVPDAAATTPAISADGNRIVFSTVGGNLSDDDQDGGAHNDLFVRDVTANTTDLVTRNTADQGQDGSSGAGLHPSISNDGRYVAFDSDAPNLSTEDNDSGANRDVFVRDLTAGTTTLVSRATGTSGAASDGSSSLARISGNGRRVAFASTGSNLGTGSSSPQQAYVRDLVSHATILVSRADGASGFPADLKSGSQPGLEISDDGTRVVFDSDARNFGDDSGGADPDTDVFMRDLLANTTELIARGTSGAPATSSFWGTISGDGSHAAFATGSALVGSDSDGQGDIYLRRISGGEAGPAPTPTPGPGPGGPTPPTAPAPVTLRGAAAFSRGTANDLYLACTKLDLYLIDVLPAGRKVAVTGAADLRLVGRKVTILLDGKKVGSAVVGADGAFKARVKAPAKRRRAKARYQARAGSAGSQKLRLVRRMVATTLKRSGKTLVLRGVVNPPRARKQPPITIERFLSCRRHEKVKVPKAKPDRHGRFAVRIKVPASARAVLYRARTKVPPRRGRRATASTFTLPRAATLRSG